MKTEDFAYIVETNKSFDEAVISVLKAVEQKGWSLFQIYDIQERLAAKGFKQKPLKIVEICSGKHANIFLKIVGMKPTIISQFFPEVSRKKTEEVEKDIKEIVDKAR